MFLAITWGELLLEPLAHIMAQYGIDPHPAVDALMVSVGLIIFAFIAGRPFRQATPPEGGKVFFAEILVSAILKFISGIIHHGARRVFVLLGTFALFILLNNLIGIVPGFNPPTDQFNVTIVLGLMTFVTAHYLGVKTHGVKYIQKFIGPLWWLSPLIFPIELISHLVRPLSLSMRLFGNMTGDHKVVIVFTSLVAVGLPVPFMGLGVLVSCLQAFVFVLLSAVYFQDAIDAPHH